jgi:hypothetical protein
MRAGDILPHPLNPRTHPDHQKDALVSSLEEFGDVRSVLCYRTADGRVQNIDGHLRASIDPDRPVKVELLTDVTEEEAAALLMTIDPLAQLAAYDAANVDHLRDVVAKDSLTVARVWAQIDEAQAAVQQAVRQAEEEGAKKGRARKKSDGQLAEQFFVFVECRNEQEQIALLRRFRSEGLTCSAKTT